MVSTERIGNKAPDWGINYGITDLWSEVSPGLWVGGTHDDDTVDLGRLSTRSLHRFEVVQPAEIGPVQFDAVVTLYAWARPVDWGVAEYRWGFGDGRIGSVDLAELADVVGWAFRRWRAGQRVLLRCQAGLNRSSLVAALVLMRSGMTSSEAIRIIRAGRSPECLFNKSFFEFLHGTLADGLVRSLRDADPA